MTGVQTCALPIYRVLDEAVALAERIGENSPIAVRLSRQLVKEAADLTEADGWKRNGKYAIEVFASGDAIEGSSAFAEKRKPNWKSQ